MPEALLQQLLMAAVVVFLAIVLRFFLVFMIRRVTRTLAARGPDSGGDDLTAKAQRLLARASGLALERHRQRVTTLGSLLTNVVNIVVVVVTVLTLLAVFGVPMTPLLASAGVGGIAIAFGAQSLVKDYLSGIFMLAEDQFGIGDLIMVGDIRGIVQEVGLRVTKVREPSGVVWYLRNGEILTLGNVSQGFSQAMVEVPVAIDEDPERVTAVLRGAVKGMADEPEWSGVLLDEPSVLGVDSMTGGTMTINILVRTTANNQWGAMREVRYRAQKATYAAGIRGPILPGVGDTPPAP